MIIDYKWLLDAYKLISGYEKELGEQARPKPSSWPCLEAAQISVLHRGVQAATDHSDHGGPGLRQGYYVVGITTHHLISLQHTTAPRPCAKGTRCQCLVKAVMVQGMPSPDTVTQLENLTQ